MISKRMNMTSPVQKRKMINSSKRRAHSVSPGKKRAAKSASRHSKTATGSVSAVKSSGIKRPEKMSMDSYIEDLLNPEKAVSISIGTVTDGENRVIRYHIKEFPGTYCSITIFMPSSDQKWAVYIPIAEDLKYILWIWEMIPRLENREKLGQWILNSTSLEFGPDKKVSGITFEHKKLKEVTNEYVFFVINSTIAPILQRAWRCHSARKKLWALKHSKNGFYLGNRQMAKHRSSTNEDSKRDRDVRVGSTLESDNDDGLITLGSLKDDRVAVEKSKLADLKNAVVKELSVDLAEHNDERSSLLTRKQNATKKSSPIRKKQVKMNRQRASSHDKSESPTKFDSQSSFQNSANDSLQCSNSSMLSSSNSYLRDNRQPPAAFLAKEISELRDLVQSSFSSVSEALAKSSRPNGEIEKSINPGLSPEKSIEQVRSEVLEVRNLVDEMKSKFKSSQGPGGRTHSSEEVSVQPKTASSEMPSFSTRISISSGSEKFPMPGVAPSSSDKNTPSSQRIDRMVSIEENKKGSNSLECLCDTNAYDVERKLDQGSEEDELKMEERERLYNENCERVLPIVIKFLSKAVLKLRRGEEISRRLERHKRNLKGDAARPNRVFSNICDDMECSIKYGSIRLASHSLQDLREYVMSNNRLTIVVSIVKGCSRFTSLLIRLLDSFMSVVEISTKICVMIRLLIKKHIMELEFVQDDGILSIARAASRNRNVPSFIINIVDIINAIANDLPEGCSIDMVIQRETIQIMCELVVYASYSDENAALKVVSFVRMLCKKFEDVFLGFQSMGCIGYLAEACYHLANRIDILTCVLLTIRQFVASDIRGIELMNNKGHAELIVECLTVHSRSNESASSFQKISEILSALINNCPNFLQSFPTHHFLANMKSTLSRKVNINVYKQVFSLLLQVLHKFPSTKSKFIALRYSDSCAPFLRKDQNEELYSMVKRLQLILNPDWVEPTEEDTDDFNSSSVNDSPKMTHRHAMIRSSNATNNNNSSSRNVLSQEREPMAPSSPRPSSKRPQPKMSRHKATQIIGKIVFYHVAKIRMAKLRLSLTEKSSISLETHRKPELMSDTKRDDMSGDSVMSLTRANKKGVELERIGDEPISGEASLKLNIEKDKLPAEKNTLSNVIREDSKLHGTSSPLRDRSASSIVDSVPGRSASGSGNSGKKRDGKSSLGNSDEDLNSDAALVANNIKPDTTKGEDVAGDDMSLNSKKKREKKKKRAEKLSGGDEELNGREASVELNPDKEDNTSVKRGSRSKMSREDSMQMKDVSGDDMSLNSKKKREKKKKRAKKLSSGDEELNDREALVELNPDKEDNTSVKRGSRSKMSREDSKLHGTSSPVRDRSASGSGNSGKKRDEKSSLGNGDEELNSEAVPAANNIKPDTTKGEDVAGDDMSLNSKKKREKKKKRAEKLSGGDEELNGREASVELNPDKEDNTSVKRGSRSKMSREDSKLDRISSPQRESSTPSVMENLPSRSASGSANSRKKKGERSSLIHSVLKELSGEASMRPNSGRDNISTRSSGRPTTRDIESKDNERIGEIVSAVGNRSKDEFLDALRGINLEISNDLSNNNQSSLLRALKKFYPTIFGGAKMFSQDLQVTINALEVLSMLKPGFQKKDGEDKTNDLISILKNALTNHIDNVDVCQKTLILCSKNCEDCDESFVELFLNALRIHKEDDNARSLALVALSKCVSSFPSSRSLICNFGGFEEILSMYSQYDHGENMLSVTTLMMSLANEGPGTRKVFGSNKTLKGLLEKLCHVVGDENLFKVCLMPVVFCLKKCVDSGTELDDGVFKTIVALIKTADRKEGDEKTASIELALRFVRDLCAFPATLKLMKRKDFSSFLVTFASSDYSSSIRRTTKSILKRISHSSENKSEKES